MVSLLVQSRSLVASVLMLSLSGFPPDDDGDLIFVWSETGSQWIVLRGSSVMLLDFVTFISTLPVLDITFWRGNGY